MVEAIAIMTFISVTLLARYALTPRVDPVQRRLLEGATVEEVVAERRLEGGPLSRLMAPSVRSFGHLLERLLPQNMIRAVQQQLIMANSSMTLPSFLFFWFVMAAGMTGLFVYLMLAGSFGGTQAILIGVFMISFGTLTPYGLLRRRAKKRQKQIQRALPDALDLLVASVEAGLGVDAAFALVADRSRGPIADIFNDYLRQVGLGQMRRDALQDVARRSGAEDLLRLADTVAQATEIGTPMGDVLRIHAADLRVRRRQRAQEAVQKAPVWMVIPLALCFIPAMVAVVIVPAILNLLDLVSGIG